MTTAIERLRGDGAASTLVAAAAVVIIVVGISLAASFVALVMLSFIVAILVAPIAGAVRRRGFPHGIGVLAALATYVVTLVGFGLITLVGLVGFIEELPASEAALAERLGSGPGSGEVGATVATAAADVAARLATSALAALGTIGYSVIIVAYLVLEAPQARRRLQWAFDDDRSVARRAASIAGRLRRYLIARAVLGAVAAVLDVVLLVVIGVPSAGLWGVLSFLLSFVPNVGFILALIPPTILALALIGPAAALVVIVGYSVINIAIDYVVQPRFVGSAVNLSAVAITVALAFWALVLGGAGAILAVPLTIVVAGLADAWAGTRWVERILANEVPPAPHSAGSDPSSEV